MAPSSMTSETSRCGSRSSRISWLRHGASRLQMDTVNGRCSSVLDRGQNGFSRRWATSVRGLGVPVDLDQVALTSLAADPGPSRVRVSRAPTTSVSGRTVTLVQEVLSTGLSATFLTAWMRRHGAAAVETCALMDREAARVVDVPVVCRGFAVPDVALAGFGLARRHEFRDLPYVARIETG